MQENNHLAAEGAPTPAAEETRTFTQEEVNRIVSERLAREKSRVDALIAQREQELVRRELLLRAQEKLAARGLPTGLLDALNLSSPEALELSLATLEKHLPRPDGPARDGVGFNRNGLTPPAIADGTPVRRAMGLT